MKILSVRSWIKSRHKSLLVLQTSLLVSSKTELLHLWSCLLFWLINLLLKVLSHLTENMLSWPQCTRLVQKLILLTTGQSQFYLYLPRFLSILFTLWFTHTFRITSSYLSVNLAIDHCIQPAHISQMSLSNCSTIWTKINQLEWPFYTFPKPLVPLTTTSCWTNFPLNLQFLMSDSLKPTWLIELRVSMLVVLSLTHSLFTFSFHLVPYLAHYFS